MSQESKAPSDAQLLSKLRRNKSGKTAASLGTTSARLRALDGVVEIGRVSTGKAGRPAILFGHVDNQAVSGATPNRDQEADGPTEAEQARSGALSQMHTNTNPPR
jgi:hypothetical protein